MIAIRWILSLIFNIQMYLAMAVISLAFAPWALFSTVGARAACKTYCRWVLFSLRILCGLKVEIRGEVPQGEVIIGAKHQSFLDIIVIFNAISRGKFIMKRELIFTPFLGQYALRIGCIPVARGKRGAAIAKMKADVARGAAEPGQLVMYPQGTRVNPGDYTPYKVGISLVYEQLGQPIVPAATNIGVFWPKRGVMRKPGTCVVEFLPAIAAGQPASAVMQQLETALEENSDRLMAEAGFKDLPSKKA